MSVQSIISSVLSVFILLSASCRINNPPDAPDTPDPITGTKKAYGLFQILIKPQEGKSAVSGKLSDGPTPSPVAWEAIMTSGEFKLLKPKTFFCEGCNGVCIAENTCEPNPDSLTADTVTISGLAEKDGTSSFTMTPTNGFYQPIGVKFVYPPCTEGTDITLTAKGTETAAPFTLKVKGIDPITVLSESVPMVDGQPVILEWVPPKTVGNSKIFILIDISYHGGTKAKIEGECVDDGSFTIPAAMLDSLKSFGISGYPKLEIARRTVGTDPSTSAQLIIESKLTLWLTIPGIISCGIDGTECPEGQYCAGDQRCRIKE